MSVRHVHAKPGEYIAVHRNHGGGGGGTSGDGMGCLTLVAVGFAIWLIVSLWEIILACLIIALAIWLIWLFRAPLGKAIGWSAKHLWSFITWSMSKIGMTVSFLTVFVHTSSTPHYFYVFWVENRIFCL